MGILEIPVSDDLMKFLGTAANEAARGGESLIGPRHFLSAARKYPILQIYQACFGQRNDRQCYPVSQEKEERLPEGIDPLFDARCGEWGGDFVREVDSIDLTLFIWRSFPQLHDVFYSECSLQEKERWEEVMQRKEMFHFAPEYVWCLGSDQPAPSSGFEFSFPAVSSEDCPELMDDTEKLDTGVSGSIKFCWEWAFEIIKF